MTSHKRRSLAMKAAWQRRREEAKFTIEQKKVQTAPAINNLLKLHRDLTDDARLLMEKKNHDYTNGSVDPFKNFRTHGLYGIAVRLNDKLLRLTTFASKGTLKVADETVNDTILDIINYAVLYAGLNNENQSTR